MATEFKLNYSGSEINRKLADVDAIKSDLENNYYTSAEIDIKFTETDGKFDEVNENIDTKIEEVNSSIDTKIDEVNTSLTFKADLIDGKVPMEQIPDDIVDLSGYYTKTEVDEEIDSTKESLNANLTFKADLIDGKVPVEQLPEDIGGGVSSWNDLEDRPFYEKDILIEPPSNISEDNTISSQPLGALDGMKFYFVKYSEAFATPEETYGAVIKLYNDGEISEYTVDNSYLNVLDNGFALIYKNNAFLPFVINANSSGTTTLPTADMLGEDMVFEIAKPGAYFIYVEGLANVVSYSNNVTKQLDDKFIPDNILRTDGSGGLILSWDKVEDKPFGEDKKFDDIIWDGDTDGLLSTSVEIDMGEDGTMTISFYKVSDSILSVSDMIGSKVLTMYLDYGGEEEKYIDDNYASENLIEFDPNGSFMDSNGLAFVYVTEGDTSLDVSEMSGVPGTAFVFPEAGTWFVHMLQNGNLVQYTSSLTNSLIKQIDAKFLPINTANGVAGLNENGKLSSEQLSIENSVNEYSDNPVTSSAVYRALGNRSELIIDNYVNLGSMNPVSGDAVYTAIVNSQTNVDSTVQQSSNNAVSSNAVYNALGGRTSLTIDNSVNIYSSNPVSSQAVYNALQNIDLSSKQDKISVTTNDNGKFMRVVNGAWAAVAVPNAEEALF